MATRKKIIVTIEKTKTGFSAYSQDYPITTTGSTINELIDNSSEAFALYFEDKGQNFNKRTGNSKK